MSTYSVVVSNVGTVATDISNPVLARKEYGEWVSASKSLYGRASGESVTLFNNGDIELEYFGTNEE